MVGYAASRLTHPTFWLAKLGREKRAARANHFSPLPLRERVAERSEGRGGGARGKGGAGEGFLREYVTDPSPGSLRASAQLATLSRKGRGEKSLFDIVDRGMRRRGVINGVTLRHCATL